MRTPAANLGLILRSRAERGVSKDGDAAHASRRPLRGLLSMRPKMNRRHMLSLLGGAAGWPLAARAQQPAAPVVGFLRSAPVMGFQDLVTPFRQGLREAGFV